MLLTSKATATLLCVTVALSGTAASGEIPLSTVGQEAGTVVVASAAATPGNTVAPASAATDEAPAKAAEDATAAASAAATPGNSAAPAPAATSEKPAKAAEDAPGTASAAATPGNSAVPAPAVTNKTPTKAAPDAPDVASAGTPADAAPSSPGTADTAPEPSTSRTAPRIWIWQGDDNMPVTVKSKHPRRFTFDPATDSGFRLRLNGNAYMGYVAETQKAAPAFTNFNSGFTINATGFLYSPRLFGYQLWTAYDRNVVGSGDRDSTGNGLSYGGSFSLLQATPVPFSISFMRTSNEVGGILTTPFSYQGRSTDISGIVRRLPVRLSYHFGIGSSRTVTADGHDFDNRYRSGEVAIRKEWKGWVIGVTDNYFRSQSRIENQRLDLNDTTQTINNLYLNVDRSFGSRLTLYVDGSLSKYAQQIRGAQSTNAPVTSMGAGVNWKVTNKWDVSFTARFSRNSVNILQLFSQAAGVPLPNPLPGVTVLKTSARTFSSTALYRSSNHWTFGATVSNSAFGLPPSLAVAAPPSGQQMLSNGTLAGNVSAAYTHRVWKFDYAASVSGGLLRYSYTSGPSASGKVFSVSQGISGGDEKSLRYGVRFTIDRTNNPVFFSLLNTNDRILDVDLARRASFVRLAARVGYSKREVGYAGSSQHLSGLNFMVTASLSRLTLAASHSASDTNQVYFGLLSPIGGGGNALPPGLLAPQVFSTNKNDTITASWQARRNLQIDSRYTRFAFTLTGQHGENQETWFDNSVQYHFGRFDIFGGFIRATGHTGNSDRRINRFKFGIKFPFQLW